MGCEYPFVYACKNRNEKTRLMSTSGGVFYALAEVIFDEGGVVFGAGFSEDFRHVSIICAKDRNEIGPLLGSKYLSSQVGDSYRKALDYLVSGRSVLYTGTACQIAGLYKYIHSKIESKNHILDRLYTMDVICHGVVEAELWRKYISFREKVSGASTAGVVFRNKDAGWHASTMSIDFANGYKYRCKYNNDPYCKLFLSDIALTQKCYNCKFKGIKERISDITAGDFLGSEYICPELDDNKGVSLVLTNTEKGKELLIKAKRSVEILKLDEIKKSMALERNRYLETAPGKHPNYAEFSSDLKQMDFIDLKNKYLGGNKVMLNDHVGIINFCHRDFPVNYGQTLLGFALYETVKKLGYQPVLLTYTKRPETSRSWYYNRYFFPDRRTPFSCSFAKTTDFLNRNGVRIVQCFDEIDLFRHAEYCDRLITGGDAVWRPAHYDSLFYLNFGEERKLRLSYSASIAHYDPSQEETYKRMFAMIENGIDYISTRERSAIQLFERIGGCYGVEPVCDPVFLLDEAQWSGFETPVPIDEKYILAYVFNDSHDYDELIEAVKKKTGVKRVIWIPTGALPERNISGSGCGVDEFIYLVHNAEAIVTNSFHGMAFSIIYKKEFFVLKRKDDSLRGDLRFSDLLSFLSLEQRMVRGVSDINNLSDIDYSFVQKLLETYTERSESWLSMALSDALGKKEN